MSVTNFFMKECYNYMALKHPDLFSYSGVFSPVFMIYKPEVLAAWEVELKKTNT